MTTVDVRPFEETHAAGIARLSTTVQWPSLTDADVVRAVCTAPGATAYVALAQQTPSDDLYGGIVGWAQALGDGCLQSFLSFLAVHPDHRRRGIAQLLVMATFQATSTKRMDLLTDNADDFYARFTHRTMRGFRIYPGADPHS